MCLAIPGKLLSITPQPDNVFCNGKVFFGGIIKEVNLSMLPNAKVGNYVLVHAGVAIALVDEEEAKQTLDYLKQMGEVDETNID